MAFQFTQVDVRNPRVLASHLMCAAKEQPLDCSAAASAVQAFAPPDEVAGGGTVPTVAGRRDAALFSAQGLLVRKLVCFSMCVSESALACLHLTVLKLSC